MQYFTRQTVSCGMRRDGHLLALPESKQIRNIVETKTRAIIGTIHRFEQINNAKNKRGYAKIIRFGH